MRVVVAFESMYGHTRQVAEAIAAGLGDDDLVITPISQLANQTVEEADLLVVGCPTHTHGMPRPGTRKAAIDSAHVPGNDQEVDPSATSTGVREWLAGLPADLRLKVATFDTRFRPPSWITGHPAARVSRELRRRGADVLDRPKSFFVDHVEQLRPGELDRARQWGKRLGERAREGAVAR